jgi:hypothetical protein
MADNRLPPRCRGLEFRSQRSPEFLDQLEERAGGCTLLLSPWIRFLIYLSCTLLCYRQDPH